MRRIAILLFAALAVLAGSAGARVWNVNAAGTGDAPNLQAAIDSCVQGDTVLAAPGTYKGAGNRDIDFKGKAILVTSISGAAATIIDCEVGEYERGFDFHSGEDTTSVLRGFTIINGNSDGYGGGIRCVGASPKIVDNVIAHNESMIGGGGIYCEGTHSIIRGNTLSENIVPLYLGGWRNAAASARRRAASGVPTAIPIEGGGNISCISDSSLIENNSIRGGKSTAGSAIYCRASAIRLKRNDISGNGGSYTEATACFESGSYDIEENKIEGNRAFGDGAGLFCLYGEYRIVGNSISVNTIVPEYGGLGGGMYCGGGHFTIEDNEILYNENEAGGGIYMQGSGVIRNNLISGNWAFMTGPCRTGLSASSDSGNDIGGGIFIGGSDSVTVVGNTITGNYAPWGGGIACVDVSPELRRNVIAGNGAFHNPCSSNGAEDGKGGGLYLANSSATVTGNTIYANEAGNDYEGHEGGAGIHCESASSPTIMQNIVAKNQTSSESGIGGIYCADAASIPSIACSDVWGNENGDYGGTLGDQTGLDGNFSADPIICDAAGGDYSIHVLSPCAPGRHPASEDCELIGALEPSCDFTATLLQGFTTSVDRFAVTIAWMLSQAGENLRCSIGRAEGAGGAFEPLGSSGIARDGMTFTFRDKGFDPGATYRYRVSVADEDGQRVLFETLDIATPSLPLTLDQNFPNPFNPSTTISYYLPEDAPVTLAIYTVSGERVATLVSGAGKKGRHSLGWDGTNESGSPVASGIYFSKLTAGKETLSRKIILMR